MAVAPHALGKEAAVGTCHWQSGDPGWDPQLPQLSVSLFHTWEHPSGRKRSEGSPGSPAHHGLQPAGRLLATVSAKQNVPGAQRPEAARQSGLTRTTWILPRAVSSVSQKACTTAWNSRLLSARRSSLPRGSFGLCCGTEAGRKKAAGHARGTGRPCPPRPLPGCGLTRGAGSDQGKGRALIPGASQQRCQVAGCVGRLDPKAAEDDMATTQDNTHAVAPLQAGAQLRRQHAARGPHQLLPEVHLQGSLQGPVQLIHIPLEGGVHLQLGPATRALAPEQLLSPTQGRRLHQGEGQGPLQCSLLLLGRLAPRLQGPVERQLQLSLLLQPPRLSCAGG